MAERVDVVEKSVEDLEKEITCAICHDHYTEPKVLPCLHYYCKQCVHRLTLRTGLDKPFSCPECRKNTTLPQGNVDELPTAFFVNRMKSVHSKLEQAHSKVEAKCEMCSGDKAKGFCRQCALFVCEKCIESHHRMKVFAGHKIASLIELKEGAKEIIMEEPPLQVCKEHDEVMKIYCFDCNCLICRDCTIEDHSGHNHKFIKKSAPEMKKKLIKQLDPLKEVKMDLSRAVEEIKSTKCEIEARGESMANDINGSFDELQRIIENHRKELLKEAAFKVTEKLKHLSVQEKSVSTSCVVVQSVIEYTEQFVKHSSNDEIMCMHAEIKSRIEKEIKEHCKDRKNLKPVNIKVKVNCAKDLKQLLKTNAIITEGIDPKLTNENHKDMHKDKHDKVVHNKTAKLDEQQAYLDAVVMELTELHATNSGLVKEKAKLEQTVQQDTLIANACSQERSCPICNTKFPGRVPQQDFERHVHAHFPR